MKKRMLNAMPTLLVLAVLLFSGLSVQAQSLSATNGAVTTFTFDQNGKVPVVYMDVDQSIATIKQEVGVNYPNQIADENSAANAALIYGRLLLERTEFYISENAEVTNSIYQAWLEVQAQANSKWPNLITQQDYDDMVTLLSL